MHCFSFRQLNECVLRLSSSQGLYLWSLLDTACGSRGRDCMRVIDVCGVSVCNCAVRCLVYRSGHYMKPCVDRQSPWLWMCHWLNGSDWNAFPAMGLTNKEPAGSRCLIASITTTIILHVTPQLNTSLYFTAVQYKHLRGERAKCQHDPQMGLLFMHGWGAASPMHERANERRSKLFINQANRREFPSIFKEGLLAVWLRMGKKVKRVRRNSKEIL